MENDSNLTKLEEMGNPNVLCLDVSSTCTGYAILECDFLGRTAQITKAGAFWLDPKVDAAQKYLYMNKALTEYFYILGYMDYLVYEQYSVNMNQRQGMLVSPEMIGAIKCAVAELGLHYDCIPPQSWRSELGIKPIKEETENKTKKDYKTPTIEKINSLTNIPEKIQSNITGKERAVPNDLYDAIGVAYGWAKRLSGNLGPCFNHVKLLKNMEINIHQGVI